MKTTARTPVPNVAAPMALVTSEEPPRIPGTVTRSSSSGGVDRRERQGPNGDERDHRTPVQTEIDQIERWLRERVIGPDAAELARLAAGDPTTYQRIDCGTLSSEATATRLTGPPPGYVGSEESGELTQAVRGGPVLVILFDEFEEAYPLALDGHPWTGH